MEGKAGWRRKQGGEGSRVEGEGRTVTPGKKHRTGVPRVALQVWEGGSCGGGRDCSH